MATKNLKIYVNCTLPTEKTTKDFKIIVRELNKASVESTVKIAVKSELRKDVYVKVKDSEKETYITVYDSKETKFISNGLTILEDCYRCEVEEVMNGLYNLELEYPTDDNKSKYLVKDNIIKASTPNGEQPFRIYRVLENLDTTIVYAKHIFFDLVANFLMDCRHKFATCQQALEDILSSTLYKHNFTCSSNIIERSNAYYIRKNPVEAILTEENSIISMYNAEILRDKFKIIANDSIGKDNHVIIEYKKNLLGLEKDDDNSEVVTRVIPTGLSSKDVSIMIDEIYVDSPLINDYINPIVKEYHFSDLKEDTEKGITIDEVKRQLKIKAEELFSKDHIDLPKTNYRINFLDLSSTEEYKDFKALEKVKLGDIVTVRHKEMNIDIKRKVVKYRWDCINKEYIEIELGDLKQTLSKDISNINSKVDSMAENNKNATELANKAIDRVSNLEEVNFRDLKQTLDEVEKLTTSNKAAVEFLNKSAGISSENIKANKEAIDNLDKSNTGLSERVNKNEGDITTLNEKVKENNLTLLEEFKKLEERIKVLEDKNKTIENKEDKTSNDNNLK
ncbi:TPA: phage tail spike protein [Clostridium perfringens]|uniref:phage tail spike protein n=1 Tax=Clostridium perfringens TaxID=1502 RepID=UPI00115C0BD9|nr:phage tail spike protein [Clostridium perfringens]EHA6440805.1 endopeptidase [Clostridium perfringens]MDM0967766.1 phage tail spike protein [Clostridium perfringens]MEA5270393.1 phage tail spike protein [Clostridium perfringens]MEA5310574.1 phage tail spike protein [Clostridium perfringens]MEA5340833.1 phage tail spike protein [Clostridium perfringens]